MFEFKGYVDKYIEQDEKITYSDGPAKIIININIGILIFLTILFLSILFFSGEFFSYSVRTGAFLNFNGYIYVFFSLFILGAVVSAIIYQLACEFVITNKRVIKKTGWIARDLKEIGLASIETISLDESIITRIFGIGSVIITGRGSESITFENLDNHVEARKKIEKIQ